MSWMVTATSWAPPRLQPDTWVIRGLSGASGEASDRERVLFLRALYAQGLCFVLSICTPALPCPPFGPPALAPATPIPAHPSFFPSIVTTIRHPISCLSPSGPGFSDLLIGKGRGDPPELSFPYPGTWGPAPWAFAASWARRGSVAAGGSRVCADRRFCR